MERRRRRKLGHRRQLGWRNATDPRQRRPALCRRNKHDDDEQLSCQFAIQRHHFRLGRQPLHAQRRRAIALGGNVVNDSASNQTINLSVVLAGLSTTAANGTNRFTTNAGAGSLTLNALSRTAGSGQAAIFTTSGGAIKTSLANDASGIIGAWATIGSDWAANDGSGNVVPYASYTAITGTPLVANAPTANYRWTGSTGTSTTAGGTTDINSLVYADAVVRTLGIASGNTLRVGATGGIFKTDSTTAAAILTVGAAGSFLTAGGAADTAGELTLNGNNVTPDVNGIVVASTINNNGLGVVKVIKTGNAAAQLNALNGYTGGTYIQSGRLRANVAGAYGTGDVYVASGAQGYLQAGAHTNNFFLGGKGFNEASPAFSGGALRLAGNTVIASGTITLLSDARITVRGAGATGAANYRADYGTVRHRLQRRRERRDPDQRVETCQRRERE